MKIKINILGRTLALILIFMLAACNLQTGQLATTEPATALPTSEPVAPITPTEEPVVFQEPDPGTLMLWTDKSYVVYVPAGEFEMGRDEIETSDHSPAHTVTLDGFWIQQTEVTNAMFALCVALGICTPPTHETGTPNWYTDPKYANAPVVGVDWNQAETYCEWIEARLPTEAEWEKAARGTDGASYPWGEEEPTCSLLNFEDCLEIPSPEIIRTYPLGASPFNLADTAGNVFEWAYDWYADDYYSSSPSSNPAGPATGEERTVRGSSYLTPIEELNITLRSSLDPIQERSDLGFRCVLTGELLTDDTPTTPACTTLSYDLVIPVHQWPQQDPIAPPPASLVTYCIEDGQGNQYGTASIILDTTVNPDSVTISSPQGSLLCNQDPNNLQKFNCGGSALQPGHPVTINICPIPPVQAMVTPTCPVYYHLNANTNMCEYGILLPVQCMAPDVVVPGYGCLPAPQNGECPTGSYAASFNNNPVCIPASGPKCQGNLCAAVCPAGLTFNNDLFCCDYPVDVQPICPPGYTFDDNFDACLPDNPIQADCTSITTPVPACPVKLGCWITSGGPSAAPVTKCVYPCPASVGNDGPCTP